MAAQTTYLDNMAGGYEGQVIEADGGENIVSRTIEDAAGIGFGKVAVIGADARGVKAPTAGGTFVGLTVRTQAIKDGEDKHAQYDNVSLLRRGVLLVKVGEAVAAGDTAYWTGTGAIMKTSASNNTFPMGAIFESAAANGGLARLRIG